MNLVVLNEVEKMLHTSPSLLRNNKLLRQAIVGVFDVDIHDVTFTNIGQLVDRIDNAILDRYFREVWQPETKKFKYSGLRIVTEVNSLKPRNVLDVGCGYNEFKYKINNLIGLDPYNKNADVTSTILDYKTETKFDVILGLGSINFGSTDKIFSELEKVVSLTSPGGKIFFRVNPGLQHNKPESKWISFYPWSTNFIVNTAAYLGVDILDIKNDNNNRMYFLWGKPS